MRWFLSEGHFLSAAGASKFISTSVSSAAHTRPAYSSSLSPQAGWLSRPDRSEAARAGAKKAPENRSLVLAACTKAYLFRVAPRYLAPGMSRLGQQSRKRLENLLGKFAVEFTDPLRLRDKGLISLLGEFGLNLDRLVERPHACELLDKRRGLLERFPGVIAVGIRDGLNADREVVRGRDCADRGSIGRRDGA